MSTLASTGPTARPRVARHPGALAWDVPAGWTALSSAAAGGGLARPRWVLNVGVDEGFARTDLDRWAAEVAVGLGLEGAGYALFTAADVAQVEHALVEGVEVWATVGVTKPTWAARLGGPAGTVPPAAAPPQPPPGTINLVVVVPAALTVSALVQAVGTATEAKAQALVEAGVPGTGTASDALVLLAGGPTPVPFAGVRSEWGLRVARAVHATVSASLTANPWGRPGTDATVVW